MSADYLPLNNKNQTCYFLLFWIKKVVNFVNKFISSAFERRHLKEKFFHLHITTSQYHNFCVCFLPFSLLIQVCLQPSKKLLVTSFHYLNWYFHLLWDWTLSTSDNKMIIRLVYIFFSLYIKSFRNKFTKLYCSHKKQSFDQLNRFLFKFSWAALVNFRRKLWIRYYLFS